MFRHQKAFFIKNLQYGNLVLKKNLPYCNYFHSSLHNVSGVIRNRPLFYYSHKAKPTPIAFCQYRSLFIQTEETPNPNSLKFLPGIPVLSPEYGNSMDFRRGDSLKNSPLAMFLMKVQGVEGVFLGKNYIILLLAKVTLCLGTFLRLRFSALLWTSSPPIDLQ